MNAPLVSVVIPFHNTAAYIREAAGSILRQQHEQLEVLCVDDASRDGSERIIRELIEVDPRARLISLPENRGLGAARNAGIDEARGRYLYFFDSDDRLDPEAIARLVARAEADELDVAYFNAEPFFDDAELERERGGYRRYYERAGQYEGVRSGQELFAAMSAADDWKPSACLQFLRRDWLASHAIRFPEGMHHEDQRFSFEAAMRARRAGYLPQAWFHRRIRHGSIVTARPGAKHVAGLLQAVADAHAIADELGIPAASPLGHEIRREMGKTYDDARHKDAGLDEAERDAMEQMLAPGFRTRSLLERMREQQRAERAEQQLAERSAELTQRTAELTQRTAELEQRTTELGGALGALEAARRSPLRRVARALRARLGRGS